MVDIDVPTVGVGHMVEGDRTVIEGGAGDVARSCRWYRWCLLSRQGSN